MPGMVVSVQETIMGPWVCGRVETVFTGRICVHFSNKRECAVEVCVPSNGSDGQQAGGSDGGPGVK